MTALRFPLAMLAIAALAHPVLAQDTPAIPAFIEDTAGSGIDSGYQGKWQYMVGGGVAAFDCNADAYPDIFLAGGEAESKFYINESERGGALKFALHQSGTEMANATGAYPLDIDSDGLTDLAILRVGETLFMRGLGQCRFERANESWGLDGGDAWWTAFSAIWEEGQSLPTLALGAYVDPAQELEPWGSCTDNWLLRPAGEGYGAPLPLKPSYCALSMLFTDWDRSGTPGLRIANDREYYTGGQEQMWKIAPGADPVLYAAADGWKTLKLWGMGIAAADVTNDGYPDYFITSMADNKLQTLAHLPADGVSKPDYKDVAFPRGAIAQRPYTGGDVRPSTAWHTQFEDVNSDGLLDIFIAKGNVDSMPDFAALDPNNLLLQQSDGKFVEAGDRAGIASMENSRGGAMPDFNLDGHVDLIVVNRWNNAQVWRNTGTGSGHWVQLKLSQPAPNRDAIGALVELRLGDRITTREISVGGGHVSGQLGFVHFGLGESGTAELRITWPGGEKSDWMSLAADSFYEVPRGAAPVAWNPPR